MFFIFFKDEVIGSGFSEGRGVRFVLGREDLDDNFEKEFIVKEILGKGI